jgi:hypothetical protein
MNRVVSGSVSVCMGSSQGIMLPQRYGVKSGHHAPATVTAMMARRSTPRRGAFISIQSKTQASIQETIAPSKLYSISVSISQLASE